MKQPSSQPERRLATFGRRFHAEMLSAVRIRAGLTDMQLSSAVFEGQSKVRSDVAAFEAGRAHPSVRILVRLCEVLRCRMDEIAPKLDAKPCLDEGKLTLFDFRDERRTFRKGALLDWWTLGHGRQREMHRLRLNATAFLSNQPGEHVQLSQNAGD